MKKINNIVFGLLVATLFAGVIPSVVLAADNESILLSGVDAHAIATNGTTSYVSDFNSTNVLTGIIPGAFVPTALVGDGAYGLSFAGGNLFVAAGKYDSASTYGGLQVLGTSAIYGKTDTYTYSKVFAVSGGSAFTAFLDSSYVPFLEAVSFAGSTITPISDLALDTVSVNDITALTVSGGFAYVGIQDSSNAGYVNVVDISNPSVMVSTGTYTTSDTITSVAVNGTTLFVGHGNKVDFVDTASLSLVSTIDTGASVNGLATDGTYLYVANANGLKVYNSSGSFVGERNTTMSATAVSVDGVFIYVATSNGTNSEVLKIKMVVITLTGAKPQTVELGAGYTELGATVSDGSSPVIDPSAFVDAIGSYPVTYTAVDASSNPGLQVTRTVKVADVTRPIITLTAPNPQTIQLGAAYVELGATTNDGSLIQIDSSAVNTSAVGSYVVTYDSVDASGNHAVQKTRTVNVAAVTYVVTASAGANGSISPSGAIVVASGNSQSFTMTPDLGYIVTDVLVDGISVGAVYNYTFTNVTAPHTIVANFVAGTYYTITASTNPNGTITPSGSVIVNSGNSQEFTITPNSGFHVVNVLIDDNSIGAVSSYTFTNVVANHTIVANFAANGGGGGGGRINPPVGTGGGAPVGGVLGAEKFIFTLFLKRTTPPPYPTTPAAYINEIMELQKFLNAHGFNSGLVDGKFGPITQVAVIKFQLANGLVGDGKVGPLTRAVLNK